MIKLIKCISSVPKNLTLNKSYLIIKETPYGYVIKLDSDEITQVDKSRFIKL